MIFEISLDFDFECKTVKEGIEKTKEFFTALGFSVNSCKPKKSIRTIKQNKALHLYFSQLAEALNDSGCDMRQFIKNDVEISWTPYSVKEYLWKPIQKIMFAKRSTTKLESKDIDKIYNILNKVVSERTGVYIPFPSKKLCGIK